MAALTHTTNAVVKMIVRFIGFSPDVCSLTATALINVPLAPSPVFDAHRTVVFISASLCSPNEPDGSRFKLRYGVVIRNQLSIAVPVARSRPFLP